MVAGVAELHAASIIHGDVKLCNVLATGPACAKVADLSGSQRLPDGARLDCSVCGVGMMYTAGMVPPDFRASSPLRFASDDVWALGVMLLCALFGGLQAWLLAERSLQAAVAAKLQDTPARDVLVRGSELVQELWAQHSSQESIDAGIGGLKMALCGGSRAEADAAAAKLGPEGRAARRELLRRLRHPCCADFASLSTSEEALLAARPYLRAAASAGEEQQQQAAIMVHVQQVALAALALARRALTVDRGARPSAADLLQEPLFALVGEQAAANTTQAAGRSGLLSCMR
jgi:serine/threonine protein kinase